MGGATLYLRQIALRRHPRPRLLSRYLEGDLETRDRQVLEAHFRKCERCRKLLGSLEGTIQALGSIADSAPTGVADSVIASLRAERLETGAPALSVVRTADRPTDASFLARSAGAARAALRYCLQRPQLRLTLPIALAAGVVLSLVNQGGMLLDGRIDFGMCAMCAMDFLVPFVTVNLGLLLVLRAPGRRRP